MLLKIFTKIFAPLKKKHLSILEYIKLSFLGGNGILKTSEAMSKIHKPKRNQNKIIKGAKSSRFGGIAVPAMGPIDSRTVAFVCLDHSESEKKKV